MNLPAGFAFSQSNLQDYADCRRRFYLRYIQRLAWPAVQAEPALENEQHMRQGAAFHRLVQQYLSGVPSAALTALAHGADLSRWWANFLESAARLPGLELPLPAGTRRFAELSLSAPLGGFRLAAKLDLLCLLPDGSALIYDWKTALQRPRRASLQARLQTLVYPYLLVSAAPNLLGSALAPEKVGMIYWFAGQPDQPERFTYSAAAFQAAGAELERLVAGLLALPEAGFTLTEDERRCRFCTYRSLCARGERAGNLAAAGEDYEADSLAGLELNFEDLPEVIY